MRKIPKKNLIGIIIGVLAVILIAVFISGARNSTSNEDEEFSVPNFPQSEKELASVPESLKDNVYLKLRGVGACDKLLGDVHVTVIFVEDSNSKWSEEDRNSFTNDCEKTFKTMEKEASFYQKDLNITADYRYTKVMFPYNYGEHQLWADSVLSSLDMSAYAEANLSLEREYKVEEAAIVFALNHSGRSFTANSENAEYSVIFKDSFALYHEICHLFGAYDYYFPDEVEEIAEAIFGNSIMDNSFTGEMDDLTAYLIGYKDDLSEKAIEFLERTNHITEEQLEEARQTS